MLSNKNFTQELMKRLHDWAVHKKDNHLEIATNIREDSWEIWIYSFDYNGGVGTHITDANFETQDFDALLKQKKEQEDKEQYEKLKRQFEKA